MRNKMKIKEFFKDMIKKIFITLTLAGITILLFYTIFKIEPPPPWGPSLRLIKLTDVVGIFLLIANILILPGNLLDKFLPGSNLFIIVIKIFAWIFYLYILSCLINYFIYRYNKIQNIFKRIFILLMIPVIFFMAIIFYNNIIRKKITCNDIYEAMVMCMNENQNSLNKNEIILCKKLIGDDNLCDEESLKKLIGNDRRFYIWCYYQDSVIFINYSVELGIPSVSINCGTL